MSTGGVGGKLHPQYHLTEGCLSWLLTGESGKHTHSVNPNSEGTRSTFLGSHGKQRVIGAEMKAKSEKSYREATFGQTQLC